MYKLKYYSGILIQSDERKILFSLTFNCSRFFELKSKKSTTNISSFKLKNSIKNF